MAIVATGVTISGAGITGEILDIGLPSHSREAIPSYHQASTSRTYLPAKLDDGGSITVDMAYTGTMPTTGKAASSYTITLPSGGGSITFTGFVTNVDGTLPLEGRATCRVTIKLAEGNS